jgi:hypothetical protein
MAIIIPDRAYAQLKASKAASDRLTTTVRRSKNTWTTAQEEQLSLIFQVIKETHDALFNIVEANG